MVNNKERYKFELGVKELNVESMDIVWIRNKHQKSERYMVFVHIKPKNIFPNSLLIQTVHHRSQKGINKE